MVFSVQATIRVAAVFAFEGLVLTHAYAALLAFELGINAGVCVVRFPGDVSIHGRGSGKGLVAERAFYKHGGVTIDLGADMGFYVVLAIIRIAPGASKGQEILPLALSAVLSDIFELHNN